MWLYVVVAFGPSGPPMKHISHACGPIAHLPGPLPTPNHSCKVQVTPPSPRCIAASDCRPPSCGSLGRLALPMSAAKKNGQIQWSVPSWIQAQHEMFLMKWEVDLTPSHPSVWCLALSWPCWRGTPPQARLNDKTARTPPHASRFSSTTPPQTNPNNLPPAPDRRVPPRRTVPWGAGASGNPWPVGWRRSGSRPSCVQRFLNMLLRLQETK